MKRGSQQVKDDQEAARELALLLASSEDVACTTATVRQTKVTVCLPLLNRGLEPRLELHPFD